MPSLAGEDAVEAAARALVVREEVGESPTAHRVPETRAGAGTQLEVLDSRVQVTQASSNRLQALFNYSAALAEFDAGSMLVDEVTIFASKLTPEGPVYEVLARAPLAE